MCPRLERRPDAAAARPERVGAAARPLPRRARPRARRARRGRPRGRRRRGARAVARGGRAGVPSSRAARRAAMCCRGAPLHPRPSAGRARSGPSGSRAPTRCRCARCTRCSRAPASRSAGSIRQRAPRRACHDDLALAGGGRHGDRLPLGLPRRRAFRAAFQGAASSERRAKCAASAAAGARRRRGRAVEPAAARARAGSNATGAHGSQARVEQDLQVRVPGCAERPEGGLGVLERRGPR